MTFLVHGHYMPRYTSGACAVYAVRLLFHPYMKLTYRTTQRPTQISLKMEIITHWRKMTIWNIIVDAKKTMKKCCRY